MRPLQLFCLALSFYTRLPCPVKVDPQDLSKATLFLPLVGWLVGGLMTLSFTLANSLWPHSTAILLALAAGILCTGALHEDGFADVCDGFGGGYTRQRILDIMQDSAIGVYGCAGLLLILSLKFSLLNDAPANAAPLLLLTAHPLSRLAPLLLMQRYPYARTNNSKAAVAVYKPTSQGLLFAATFAVLPLLLLPARCWLAILPVLMVNALLGRYFNRHIGGYTGDCLGASQQIAEIIFYLSTTALWTSI